MLLRHGETEWSRTGQHTGTTDVPLTPAGEQAARSLAGALDSYHFSLVLSSPLQRARRTAELAGVSAELDPDLREWDYGAYEGLTTEQIRADLGYDWTIFEHGVPPGDTPGESIEDVAARASGWSAERCRRWAPATSAWSRTGISCASWPQCSSARSRASGRSCSWTPGP